MAVDFHHPSSTYTDRLVCPAPDIEQIESPVFFGFPFTANDGYTAPLMQSQGETKDPTGRPQSGIIEQRVLLIDRRASWRGSRRSADWLKHQEEEATDLLKRKGSPWI